jgi:Ion transport protein
MQGAAFSQGIDQIPSHTIQEPLAAIYFVIVVIVGNFFLLNLFVGVILTTYNREKELVGKDFMLTDLQKKWLKNRQMIVTTEPKFKMKLPFEDWRQPFFYTAESSLFQNAILVIILANTVVLMI